MKKLAPGQVLTPNEHLAEYREFDQNGMQPGPRKLAQFRAALRARGTPPLYAQEGKEGEATVYVKLFDPCSSATWGLLEWDETTNEAFCYVTGLGDDECGYVTLDELAAVEGRLGIGIELDVHFLPAKLREVRKLEGRSAKENTGEAPASGNGEGQ